MSDDILFTNLDSDPENAAEPVKVSSPAPRKPSSGKRRKKRKWIKWVIILAILAVIGAALYSRTRKMAGAMYEEETAALRDIRTYHSFTGTVAPITTRSITSSVSGVKIAQLPVKEGDAVREGDILMVLDTSGIDEQILEKQASIDRTSYSNSLSIQSAQNSYNNLKNNLASGMDTSVMSAQNQMDSAYANLVSAQQAFNDEVSLNNDQMSSSILSAKQSVDSAYDAVASRALATKQARENRERALQSAIDKGIDFDSFTYDQQIESAELSEQQAWSSYNQALERYEQAKLNEESTLTRLYDQLTQAQNSYLSAVDSYNAAVNNSQQQLKTYEMQVQQAYAQADDSVSRLQLEDLKTNLDDYVLYAPISGEITSLNVDEGDTISAASGTLATIVDFDRMKVDIRIGEYDILGARVGQEVTVIIDALNKEYTGTIAHIDRMASVENGVSYYKAEVDFDADEDIRSGMSSQVRLKVYDLSGVVTISCDAVQTAEDGSSYVMVAGTEEGSKINWAVTLGASDGTYQQITDGLAAGETVYYIKPVSFNGMQVQMGGR